jgi:predicted DNA-binding transcriptional regulator AlpA
MTNAPELGSPTAMGRGEATVSLSKWVNEKLPACDQILSARDVARLTRRRRWVVYALTLFGQFPKRQRFHGRAIGWAKSDVLKCQSENSTFQRRFARSRYPVESRLLLQQMLPMHFPRTRRWRGRCASRRKGSRL